MGEQWIDLDAAPRNRASAQQFRELRDLLDELAKKHQTGDTTGVWTEDELAEYMKIAFEFHDLYVEATGESPSVVLFAAKNAYTALAYNCHDTPDKYTQVLVDLEERIEAETA